MSRNCFLRSLVNLEGGTRLTVRPAPPKVLMNGYEGQAGHGKPDSVMFPSRVASGLRSRSHFGGVGCALRRAPIVRIASGTSHGDIEFLDFAWNYFPWSRRSSRAQ
jgi:hypothetical protein